MRKHTTNTLFYFIFFFFLKFAGALAEQCTPESKFFFRVSNIFLDTVCAQQGYFSAPISQIMHKMNDMHNYCDAAFVYNHGVIMALSFMSNVFTDDYLIGIQFHTLESSDAAYCAPGLN